MAKAKETKKQLDAKIRKMWTRLYPKTPYPFNKIYEFANSAMDIETWMQILSALHVEAEKPAYSLSDEIFEATNADEFAERPYGDIITGAAIIAAINELVAQLGSNPENKVVRETPDQFGLVRERTPTVKELLHIKSLLEEEWAYRKREVEVEKAEREKMMPLQKQYEVLAAAEEIGFDRALKVLKDAK